ncbi:cytochrome B [Limnochorda pilosa]|uniref:Cytochrome B n=1 Tax=Limnochorda pilosa TaxID=1555112 RepID=A0A0K2SGJ3_LIMPI|nr:cytochrome B [Limnochorda pilosa]
MMVSAFVVLSVTGLPQMFSGSGTGGALLGWLGGQSSVRAIHRGAAVVFMAVFVCHVLERVYRVLVQGRPFRILPGPQDVRDLIDEIRYDLGLRAERPRYGRFSYAEKVEYWSLIWGAVIMGASGLLLWNGAATAVLTQPVVVAVARVVHGWEAVLAVLAIVIWHVYHVHVRHVNRSMFTGYLTREEMLEEHPRELEEAGETPPVVMGWRRSVRLAGALLSTGLVVCFVVAAGWWMSLDPSGLVPPEEARGTVLAATPRAWGPSVPHDVSTRPGCGGCHGTRAAWPGPGFTAQLPAETCLSCHAQQ